MNQFQLGYKAASDAVKGIGSIHQFIQESSYYSATTAQIFAGAVSCVLHCFVALRDAGLIPKHADTDTNQFIFSPASVMACTLQRSLANHACGRKTNVENKLQAMCDAVFKHRAKINFVAPKVNSEAPQAIDVREVNLPAASTEAAPVKIVSMPMRITTSKINRDNNGNIVSAHNIEQDVATPT